MIIHVLNIMYVAFGNTLANAESSYASMLPDNVIITYYNNLCCPVSNKNSVHSEKFRKSLIRKTIYCK